MLASKGGMATKYDLFEIMYTKGTVLSPHELLRLLQQPASAYSTLYQNLLRLQQEGLIRKTPQGFQVKLSVRSTLLYRLIRFCLANDLRYNDLLDEKSAAFIQKAWQKQRFSARDFALNPRTFTKYVELFYRSGFLIIFSRKPLSALLLQHSFLAKLGEYFGLALPPKNFPDKEIILPLMREELQLFHRLKKKNEREYLTLVQNYQLRFIQHSLNLEGNPITLPETVKLLQHQLVPETVGLQALEEVRNYQRAIQAMLNDAAERKPLTLTSILNYHYLALQHRPAMAGRIRHVPVVIKNNPRFKIALPAQINGKLRLFLQKYNRFIAKKKHSLAEIFHFAAGFHNEFQHIHPFMDGNSRTTRLITFHLLRSLDLPVIDIPLGLLEEYLSSTKGAVLRNDQRLRRVLELVVLYNVKLFNEHLK